MSSNVARHLSGVAVLAVAVIAAIVSFAHIESLALANGYAIDTARLLPFSVDGLILSSSLALAAGARPWLARLGLVLGVAATVAANVVFGVRYGVTGAIVNAWPAVAFIVSSEIMVGMLRGARDVRSSEGAAGTVAAEVPAPHVSTPQTVADAVPVARVSVPQDGPGGTGRDVPDDVPAVAPVASLRRIPARAPRRASPGRPKSVDHMFTAEIEAGKLPSLRQVKERMHVGTDRARSIRDQLAQDLQEAQEAA